MSFKFGAVSVDIHQVIHVVLLSSVSEVSAIMQMAFEADERFCLVGTVTDVESAHKAVVEGDAKALVYNNDDVDSRSLIGLREALPGIGLLAFAPGIPLSSRRFVRNTTEIEWAETALSVTNALAIALQVEEHS